MYKLPEDIQDAIDHAIEDVEDSGKEIKIPFWESDPEDVAYIFMTAGAEIEIDFPDFDLNTLPRGYWLGLKIFSFERECLNDGWGALCNLPGNELTAICDAYSQVGCPEEANALQKAASVSGMAGASIEEIGAAYSSINNPWKDEEVRHEQICKFFKRHPELFAA